MAPHPVIRSSILYQNAARDITLVDIPTSIAVAQGRSDVLLSTPPLEAPIEPKEDYRPKAQTPQAREPSDAAKHAVYKTLIQQALADIHSNVASEWCAPRRLLTQRPQHGDTMDIDDPEKELETQMREWAACEDSKGDDNAFDLQAMMASLGATSEHGATPIVAQGWTASYSAAREATSGTQVAETVTREPWSSSFHNPEKTSLHMTVSKEGQLGAKYRFTIPPHSTFFLGDTTQPEHFRTSFRRITDEHTLPRHFDLVLLDPPWPNRSAKRKNAYDQSGGMPYIKRMLLRMDLEAYMEHNALVGVWVTNKSTLREHVLGPGGLFETWNVGLIEEWIWIKTTTKGEPMFDIDTGAAMRKPYEVLLLGRAAPNSWTTMAHATNVKLRVIAAVPGIHSRKPCLKELLEEYMPDSTDYAALEVFSRYLVPGWTSWGNEVLKYNWNYYWANEAVVEARSEHKLPMRMA